MALVGYTQGLCQECIRVYYRTPHAILNELGEEKMLNVEIRAKNIRAYKKCKIVAI